jgi:ADP-heptose:LPS heptosyltransferase
VILAPGRVDVGVRRNLSPQRILILKPCCLGDLVQTTAVIAAVHQHWPAAAITVGTGRHSAPAVAHHPAVAALLDVGGVGVHTRRHPLEPLRLLPILRRQRFDLTIVPDRSPVLSVLTRLAGIPIRAGYDSGGRGRWYTTRSVPLPRAHELDQAQRLLTALGIAELSLPHVYPGEEGMAQASAILGELPTATPLAIIAPGGGENPGMRMLSKRWSTSGFSAIARVLQQAGATVILVGAAADRPVTASVAREAPKVYDLAGRTSLAALGGLAARASVYIGNDSGTTHLAAAAGCPTVAIFGPTAPELYAPRGRWVRIVAPGLVDRAGGNGTVRDPYVFGGAWQDNVSAAEVGALALAGLRLSPAGGD